MFEVITQSQPQDYQSLEILKEAYSKLGRDKDVVNTSKRIAGAYVELGQLSSAILEYESILQRFPEDPQVLKALADIENRANSFSPSAPETDFMEKATASSDFRKGDGLAMPSVEVEDGKAQMQKIMVDGRLVAAADFNLHWPTPNLRESPRMPTEPFILTLAEKQILPLDQSMKALCEKGRVGYIPLDKYDVDVELARSFPRDLALRWCALPFDKMSKSLLVATCNPFNKTVLRELESVSKARVIYYMVSPNELLKALKKIYR